MNDVHNVVNIKAPGQEVDKHDEGLECCRFIVWFVIFLLASGMICLNFIEKTKVVV